jgi:hypothetical protein
MLFFTPRADEKLVNEVFKLEGGFLQTYHELLAFIERNQLHTFPFDALSPEKKEEFVALSNRYRSQRDVISRLLPRMEQIADRYGGSDITPYFLEWTETPDYNERRQRFFGPPDARLWQDGMQQLLGRIDIRRSEDSKKLWNPLNWFYLPIRALLIKLMGLFSLSGGPVSRFWGKFAELLAGVAALALILFVLFWCFGVPSDKIRDILIKRLEGGH